MGCCWTKAATVEAPPAKQGSVDGELKNLLSAYVIEEQIVVTTGTFIEAGVVILEVGSANGPLVIDRRVAIKILERAKNREHRLNMEVKILQQIGKHPSIVELLDVFEETNSIQLVFELMSGGELFEYLVKEGPFSERRAAVATRKLLEALRYLHKRGIVHRDIKPENLLLTKAEGNDDEVEIKLADFGLSRLRVGREAMRTVCGTWAYSAPEVRIFRRPYSHKVDLWSLGVITFVLLSGYHPFDPDGDVAEEQLQYNIRYAVYDFDDPVWDDISPEAKDFVARLLVVDPSRRMDSGAALAHPWIRRYNPRQVTKQPSSTFSAGTSTSPTSRQVSPSPMYIDVYPSPVRQVSPSHSRNDPSAPAMSQMTPTRVAGAGALPPFSESTPRLVKAAAGASTRRNPGGRLHHAASVSPEEPPLPPRVASVPARTEPPAPRDSRGTIRSESASHWHFASDYVGDPTTVSAAVPEGRRHEGRRRPVAPPAGPAAVAPAESEHSATAEGSARRAVELSDLAFYRARAGPVAVAAAAGAGGPRRSSNRPVLQGGVHRETITTENFNE